MTTDNMELWNKVCKTDPEHTKKVNQRGGFTAIDAMYQIQTATEVFGAVGKGWGWNFSAPIFPPNGTVFVKCTLWHGDKETTVEQFGQKKLDTTKGADEDAVKKAATDALTKCLSYLGFNADVFLGKFDDNKYVEQLKKENAKNPRVDEIYQSHIKQLSDFKDKDEFKAWWDNPTTKAERQELNNLDADKAKALVKNMKTKIQEFVIDEIETPSGLI